MSKDKQDKWTEAHKSFCAYAIDQLLVDGGKGLKSAIHAAMVWASQEGFERGKREKKLKN